jgi:hypothetical protein
MLGLFILLAFAVVLPRPITADPGNRIDAKVRIVLSGDYAIWGASHAQVFMDFDVWVEKPDSPVISMIIPFATEVVSVTEGASYETIYNDYLQLSTRVEFPSELGYVHISTRGTLFGSIVAYRSFLYLLGDPLEHLEIEGLSGLFNEQVIFVLPDGSEVAHGYPIPSDYVVEERSIIFTGRALKQTMGIAYQPHDYEVYAFSIALAFIALFIVVSFRGSEIVGFVRGIPGSRYFDKLTKKLGKVDLLKVALFGFIATSSLMLSIALAIGSDPTPNVLILAQPSQATEIAEFVKDEHPNVDVFLPEEWIGIQHFITPFQGASLVIVGDFVYSPAVMNLLSYLKANKVDICLLQESADTELGGVLTKTWEEWITPLEGGFTVKSLSDVGSVVLYQIGEREAMPRVFYLSLADWSQGVKALAVLSVVLVFFASLLFATVATRVRGKSPIIDLGISFVSLLAIFCVVIAVYLEVSRVISLPLVAHAMPPALYGYPLTAMGYIGFGGGNTLRFAAGFSAVALVLLLVHLSKAQELNFALILPATGAFLIVLTLPVTGVMANDLLLSWSGAEAGRAYGIQAVTTFSDVMNLFALPLWSPERGIMMYFFAGIGIAGAKYFRRGVRTMTLIFMALFFARGLTRVGNLDPYTTMGILMPGVLFGLFLLGVAKIVEEVYVFIRSRL